MANSTVIPDAVRDLSREMLLGILISGLPNWDDPELSRNQMLCYAREQLVACFGCKMCGAKIGQECKPEYGCTHTDRDYFA